MSYESLQEIQHRSFEQLYFTQEKDRMRHCKLHWEDIEVDHMICGEDHVHLGQSRKGG